MYNFGNINNAFSEVLMESFINKKIENKKIIKSYLKTINENKLLKTQYHIYKNISEKYETNDAKITQYIKESIGVLDKFSIKEIKEQNNILVKLIGEDSKTLQCEYDKKELHENISTLIVLSKSKTTKDIDNIVESFNFILNYIKNNKPEEKNESINEGVIHLAMNKFNDKYSTLSLDESSILRSIINSDTESHVKLFNDNIRECVDLIDSNLLECDIETKDKLLKVKDKVLRMSYNNDSFISDISKIIELKRDLI